MRQGTARSRITITHHGSRITITKPTQIIQTTPLFLPDPLPEQLALPLLGVPVVLRSNATAVITVAREPGGRSVGCSGRLGDVGFW